MNHQHGLYCKSRNIGNGEGNKKKRDTLYSNVTTNLGTSYSFPFKSLRENQPSGPLENHNFLITGTEIYIIIDYYIINELLLMIHSKASRP